MKKVYYTANQYMLSPMANEIVFQQKIKNIFEELISSYNLLKEEENTDQLSPEEKKAMDSVMNTFVSALSKEKSSIQSIASDEKKVDAIEKQFPELQKLDASTQEGKIDEFVISATLVAGIIAAIPSLIKIFSMLVKGVGSILNTVGLGKAGDKVKKFAEKIAHASHEMHKAYIALIDKALVNIIPEYGKLEQDKRNKIAEAVYMIIVLYLGINAGVSAFHELSIGAWVPGGVEGALSAIKAGEVGTFMADAIAVAVKA